MISRAEQGKEAREARGEDIPARLKQAMELGI
jgi:hypothetical protein